MGVLSNGPADRLVGARPHIMPLLDAIGRSVASKTKQPSKGPLPTRLTAVKVDLAPERHLDVTDSASRVLSGGTRRSLRWWCHVENGQIPMVT